MFFITFFGCVMLFGLQERVNSQPDSKEDK